MKGNKVWFCWYVEIHTTTIFNLGVVKNGGEYILIDHER